MFRDSSKFSESKAFREAGPGDGIVGKKSFPNVTREVKKLAPSDVKAIQFGEELVVEWCIK